ncbi:hypothetical protein [Hyphomicrobium sp.]|uniref:hypothetical protein n=1 Tax=Hyphomicrobium sp. TaxID=82 RepID=UPI003F6F1974
MKSFYDRVCTQVHELDKSSDEDEKLLEVVVRHIDDAQCRRDGQRVSIDDGVARVEYKGEVSAQFTVKNGQYLYRSPKSDWTSAPNFEAILTGLAKQIAITIRNYRESPSEPVKKSAPLYPV